VIRAWIADASGVRAVEPDEAVRVAGAQGPERVWLDLEDADETSTRAMLAPLDIHALVLEDMLGEVNRPKVDDYGSLLYVVVHSARWDETRPYLRELDLVITERYLVSCHDGSTRSVAEARELLPRRPELLAAGPAHLLHFLLDVLVDHYLPIVDRVAEELDRIDDRVFGPDDSTAHAEIVRLKRGMSALRRIVGPQRDTVLALTRDEYRVIPADMRPYLRDVYDRLARVSDLLDSFRDEAATLLDLQVSVVSNRMNEVIKRLTVIATVGLPLTLITGYYGMNFALPEYHWPHATLYVIGLLFATAGATWWLLKRRRWM
jgi:magnesium transporter